MEGLSLKNIGRQFGSAPVVSDVNLQLVPGEFVSLLGPSGCGKTTTLRMIAGFLDPTSGTIELDGKEISSSYGCVPPEKRGMSMVFQSYAVWPNMTVAENVGFGLKIRKVSGSELKRRVGEILEVVQMSHLAERYPAELSGGQQQRIALARAVVIRPAVLLLDEPLSNLDANLREEMRYEIKRIHDEFRITSVYVTHDQSEAMVTSDRIAVMNRGRIEQIDTPFTLYARPKTRFVASFIGRTNFLTARLDADALVFDGFAVPLTALPDAPLVGPEINVSVRPQALSLHRKKPLDHILPGLGGSIVARAFLGESWDYLFQVAGSETTLKVVAPPADVFDVGSDVWMAMDYAQFVPIQ
jgi:ABC-type Fe3+/spermidine/putrescine transport system ATPase subunit